MKVVVIPDIHGRLDALEAMLVHSGIVDGRWKWKGGRGQKLVQLGDLVDRGPHSKECVDLMMKIQEQAPSAVTILRGNHEEMLCGAVRDPASKPWWLENGGEASVKSWGSDFENLCALDGPHYRWMSSLPTSMVLHDVLFVHGGLSQENSEKMDPEHLMWDRPPHVTGKYRALVCGHTPTESGRIEIEENIFHCDLGLGHKDEAAFQYLNLMVTPNRVRGAVHVAPALSSQ